MKYKHWKLLAVDELAPGGQAKITKRVKVGFSRAESNFSSNELFMKLGFPDIIKLGIRAGKAFHENIDFSQETEITRTFVGTNRSKGRKLWTVYQLMETYCFYQNISVYFLQDGSHVARNIPFSIPVNKHILDKDRRSIGLSRFNDRIRKIIMQAHSICSLTFPSLYTVELTDPP